MLNRAVLIARPAKPFIDWAATLDDSGLVPSAEGEQSVYLVPQFDDDEELKEVLELAWAEIFERELYGWHAVEEDWPKDRTLAMFLEWFSIEFHTILEDLCDGPIVDDEFDDQDEEDDDEGGSDDEKP